MPLLALGLQLLIAIFLAIHAIRSARKLYWLVILFMLPLLGSIVYCAVVFLPHSRLRHGACKAGAAIQTSLDPGGELRDAQTAFDLTPTANHQMRLAAALLDAGKIAPALELYDALLGGPLAADAEIGVGAAHAKLANGEPQAAIGLLVTLRARQPNFRPEQIGMLLASAYEAAGRQEEAGAEYEAMTQHFGSIEARAGLALWAIAQGQRALAARELTELDHTRKHLSNRARHMHQDLFRRLDAASTDLR